MHAIRGRGRVPHAAGDRRGVGRAVTRDGALFGDPYLNIIVDEAQARGVTVEVVDRDFGVMRMSHGTRVVLTRGSLTELASAVAATLCDHKLLTGRVLEAAGLRV